MPRNGYFLPIVAGLGYAFLYAPIISLIVYSFNESQLVTVWSGFSTKWYGKLLQRLPDPAGRVAELENRLYQRDASSMPWDPGGSCSHPLRQI